VSVKEGATCEKIKVFGRFALPATRDAASLITHNRREAYLTDYERFHVDVGPTDASSVSEFFPRTCPLMPRMGMFGLGANFRPSKSAFNVDYFEG
jgi:hypothetical protein